MTLLSWAQEPNRVAIMSDTLLMAPHPETGPAALQHKLSTYPALNLVMAGTGLVGLIQPWAVMLATRPELAYDLEAVVALAPGALRAIDAQVRARHDELPRLGKPARSTISRSGPTAASSATCSDPPTTSSPRSSTSSRASNGPRSHVSRRPRNRRPCPR